VRISVCQLGRWRKGEQNSSKHRKAGSGKAKREGSSSRRGERVRRKTRLTSSEDTTGTEEEHIHSSEEDADPRGGLGDWNNDSENDEVGGEDDDEFWEWSPGLFSRMQWLQEIPT
jgi:hypothetical protein